MSQENILLYQQQIGCTLNALADEVQCIASTAVENPLIFFRVKDPETLKQKMYKKGVKSVFSIHDVYGIRVIVESVDDAYAVFNKIKTIFPARLANDFIAQPKKLLGPGFEGKMLRMLRIVAHKNCVPFEVQITTDVFHKVNESHHVVYRQTRYLS